jgi:hypothetical protein
MPPEVFCDSTIENDDHVETDIVTEPCGPKTDIWSRTYIAGNFYSKCM